MSGTAVGAPGGRGLGATARSWAIAVVTGSVLFVALVGVLAVLGWHVLLASGPRGHDDPSFRFGESVMRTDVYQGLYGGSVAAACRQAMPAAAHKPVGFALNEAVAGCRFEEHELDN